MAIGYDVIDVRDVIERVEELESELEDAREEATDSEETNLEFQEWVEAVRKDASPAHTHEMWDEAVEYQTLTSLLSEIEGHGGDHQWRGNWYPNPLVRDEYFKEYAQRFAEDIGAIDPNASWPCNCIDWEQAAEVLQRDYSSVEYDGDAYWYM